MGSKRRLLLVIVCLLISLPGCGDKKQSGKSGSDDASHQPARPPVTIRQATAQQVLETEFAALEQIDLETVAAITHPDYAAAARIEAQSIRDLEAIGEALNELAGTVYSAYGPNGPQMAQSLRPAVESCSRDALKKMLTAQIGQAWTGSQVLWDRITARGEGERTVFTWAGQKKPTVVVRESGRWFLLPDDAVDVPPAVYEQYVRGQEAQLSGTATAVRELARRVKSGKLSVSQYARELGSIMMTMQSVGSAKPPRPQVRPPVAQPPVVHRPQVNPTVPLEPAPPVVHRPVEPPVPQPTVQPPVATQPDVVHRPEPPAVATQPAVSKPARPGKIDSVAAAVEALPAEDTWRKREALNWLKKETIDQPDDLAKVVAAIQPMLDAEDKGIRFQAMEIFCKVARASEAATVERLAKMDRAECPTGAALAALLRLSVPKGRALMIARCDDFFYRMQAKDVLVAMGEPAEAIVLPLLGEKNKNARALACDVLAAVGTPKCIPAFNAAYRRITDKTEKFFFKGAAERAVKQIKERAAK